jgi:uncharacterized membrane protein YvbJ
MSLINCTECNRKISDKADSCPGCGIAINNSKTTDIDNSNVNSKINSQPAFKMNFIIKLLLSSIIVGLFIYLISLMKNEKDDFDPEKEWKHLLINKDHK